MSIAERVQTSLLASAGLASFITTDFCMLFLCRKDLAQFVSRGAWVCLCIECMQEKTVMLLNNIPKRNVLGFVFKYRTSSRRFEPTHCEWAAIPFLL